MYIYLECYSYEEADRCEAENGTFYLKVCYNKTIAEQSDVGILALNATKRPPAEEYFE